MMQLSYAAEITILIIFFITELITKDKVSQNNPDNPSVVIKTEQNPAWSKMQYKAYQGKSVDLDINDLHLSVSHFTTLAFVLIIGLQV